MKLRYMKYVSLALGLCFLLSMFSSCRSRLQDALESAENSGGNGTCVGVFQESIQIH